eukprot:jgi/Botrbrau1/5470/Bobra.27_1s0020.1
MLAIVQKHAAQRRAALLAGLAEGRPQAGAGGPPPEPRGREHLEEDAIQMDLDEAPARPNPPAPASRPGSRGGWQATIGEALARGLLELLLRGPCLSATGTLLSRARPPTPRMKGPSRQCLRRGVWQEEVGGPERAGQAIIGLRARGNEVQLATWVGGTMLLPMVTRRMATGTRTRYPTWWTKRRTKWRIPEMTRALLPRPRFPAGLENVAEAVELLSRFGGREQVRVGRGVLLR